MGARWPRLWSPWESSIFVDQEGNTVKEVVSEQEVVRHDQQQEESIKIIRKPEWRSARVDTDVRIRLPFLLLSSTPRDMPPCSQDGSKLVLLCNYISGY